MKENPGLEIAVVNCRYRGIQKLLGRGNADDGDVEDPQEIFLIKSMYKCLQIWGKGTSMKLSQIVWQPTVAYFQKRSIKSALPCVLHQHDLLHLFR